MAQYNVTLGNHVRRVIDGTHTKRCNMKDMRIHHRGCRIRKRLMHCMMESPSTARSVTVVMRTCTKSLCACRIDGLFLSIVRLWRGRSYVSFSHVRMISVIGFDMQRREWWYFCGVGRSRACFTWKTSILFRTLREGNGVPSSVCVPSFVFAKTIAKPGLSCNSLVVQRN